MSLAVCFRLVGVPPRAVSSLSRGREKKMVEGPHDEVSGQTVLLATLGRSEKRLRPFETLADRTFEAV